MFIADIDECAENKTIDCENNKVCQNTEGGFKCGCKSGERLAWTGYCVREYCGKLDLSVSRDRGENFKTREIYWVTWKTHRPVAVYHSNIVG